MNTALDLSASLLGEASLQLSSVLGSIECRFLTPGQLASARVEEVASNLWRLPPSCSCHTKILITSFFFSCLELGQSINTVTPSLEFSLLIPKQTNLHSITIKGRRRVARVCLNWQQTRGWAGTVPDGCLRIHAWIYIFVQDQNPFIILFCLCSPQCPCISCMKVAQYYTPRDLLASTHLYTFHCVC